MLKELQEELIQLEPSVIREDEEVKAILEPRDRSTSPRSIHPMPFSAALVDRRSKRCSRVPLAALSVTNAGASAISTLASSTCICATGTAIAAFERASQHLPRVADVFYFLALALLAFTPLRRARTPWLTEAESTLCVARRLDPAHPVFAVLDALITLEHYTANGFRRQGGEDGCRLIAHIEAARRDTTACEELDRLAATIPTKVSKSRVNPLLSLVTEADFQGMDRGATSDVFPDGA